MSAEDDLVTTMRVAVRAVRREGYKVAVIYAVLDGALLALFTSLIVTLLGVDVFLGPAPAVGVGFVGSVVSFSLRVRRPIIERFEAVNPAIEEALRTARDALDDDSSNAMARALYADVVDRLQRTSSLGLLSIPRIGARFLLLFALSLAIVQASVVGIDLGDAVQPSPSASGNDRDRVTTGVSPTPSSLQPGDDVLGEPETITPGNEDLSTTLRRQAGAGDDEREREFETGGLVDNGAIEAERAGYAPSDDVENAELIKAYNLRIREETDD